MSDASGPGGSAEGDGPAAAGAAGSAATDVAEPAGRDVMLRDVLDGLSRPQKELSPKYFYDQRGSELFEEITRLNEYYPTRTERALLERWASPWVEELRPAALVELGAGSAEKSRIVLDAMDAHGSGELYVPVDVSAEFLYETAQQLRSEYDDLRVEPEVADISRPLELSVDVPEPSWFALLGSTIGNFEPQQAARLLCRIARCMRSGDRLLLGVDLVPGPHKSVSRLESAYNDAGGVTAAFNRNILRVLNRELGSDFDASAFRHRAFWDPAGRQIEMHLVSDRDQVVRFPDGSGRHEVALACGESIRTEVSRKYDRQSVEELFAAADLHVERWVEDERKRFALVVGRPE